VWPHAPDARVCLQVDLGDMENEVRSAEETAKKALADSQRFAEDLRRQQDAVSSSEKQRRTYETQACDLAPQWRNYNFCPRQTFATGPRPPLNL